MFNRLKNRFLILILVTIFVMMAFAFSTIYLITYNDVHADVDMELHKILESYRKINDSPSSRPYPENQQSRDFSGTQTAPERSVSFTLMTDKESNIIDYFSVFEMEDDFYETAKKIAVSKKSSTGKFKLDGTYWAFNIVTSYDGYKIAFLDITSRQGILKNLIYTFLVVAMVMLIFIYFISRFFANKAINPIKEAFDKQKQFIADASHELKTPLTVINTNADLLLSHGEDKISNQSKWLYYIKSETERMNKLTSDLLYLAQVDYSDIKMIAYDFDLSKTVEYIILTMEAVIYEKDLLFEYEIEPGLYMSGNNEQIKQVVMILLDNAIKYTNAKGNIKILLKQHHNSSVLSITNSGEGISEEHTSRIFDRFYRTDKSRTRNSGGYGLGLAIAKAIIEQHKGELSVKSILNESTTFILTLPVR